MNENIPTREAQPSPTQATRATRGATLPPILYPEALKAYNLVLLLDDFDVVQNIASIELLLSIAAKDKDKSMEEIQSVFQQLRVPLPTTISIE